MRHYKINDVFVLAFLYLVIAELIWIYQMNRLYYPITDFRFSAADMLMLVTSKFCLNICILLPVILVTVSILKWDTSPAWVLVHKSKTQIFYQQQMLLLKVGVGLTFLYSMVAVVICMILGSQWCNWDKPMSFFAAQTAQLSPQSNFAVIFAAVFFSILMRVLTIMNLFALMWWLRVTIALGVIPVIGICIIQGFVITYQKWLDGNVGQLLLLQAMLLCLLVLIQRYYLVKKREF